MTLGPGGTGTNIFFKCVTHGIRGTGTRIFFKCMTCGPGGAGKRIYVECVTYRPGRGHRPNNILQVYDPRAMSFKRRMSHGRGRGTDRNNNIGHVYDSRGPGHGRNNMVYVHPHPCMHRVHVPTEQIRPSTSEESTTVKSPLPARPGGGGPMMPNVVVEGRPDA